MPQKTTDGGKQCSHSGKEAVHVFLSKGPSPHLPVKQHYPLMLLGTLGAQSGQLHLTPYSAHAALPGLARGCTGPRLVSLQQHGCWDWGRTTPSG